MRRIPEAGTDEMCGASDGMQKRYLFLVGDSPVPAIEYGRDSWYRFSLASAAAFPAAQRFAANVPKGTAL